MRRSCFAFLLSATVLSETSAALCVLSSSGKIGASALSPHVRSAPGDSVFCLKRGCAVVGDV